MEDIVHVSILKVSILTKKKGVRLKCAPADRAPFIPMKLLAGALSHKHVILPGQEMTSVLRSTIDFWQTSGPVLI